MSKLAVSAWLPWAGGIVIIGLVGGALGLAGVFGHPTTERAVVATSTALTRTATAYSCPGGPAVDTLDAGDKVLAIQRSDDSAYLGVRNPKNLGQELWFRTADVTVNPAEPAIATLPVGSCPQISVSILMPPTNQTDTPPVATAPTKPVKPAAPDTTAPTIGTPTAASAIACNKYGSGPYTDAISVTAADNVGVTSVSISWSGATSGSGAMTRSGAQWTYSYDTTNSTGAGTVTFQLQARDAAGNLSNPVKINLTQGGCVS